MIRIVKAAVLLMLVATTIAAQKEGNVTIRSNVPIKITVTGADAPSWVLVDGAAPISKSLSTGEYTVRLEFPDGSSTNRTVTVRKNCTTQLDVDYKPPTCPACAPAVTPTPNVVTMPKPAEPEFTFKPEPVPTRFDECCGCRRDDLKARLDLFAIQLHQNPTAQGRIIAPTLNTEALLYLIHQRGVDHKRVELQVDESKCVELWIVP